MEADAEACKDRVQEGWGLEVLRNGWNVRGRVGVNGWRNCGGGVARVTECKFEQLQFMRAGDWEPMSTSHAMSLSKVTAQPSSAVPGRLDHSGREGVRSS